MGLAAELETGATSVAGKGRIPNAQLVNGFAPSRLTAGGAHWQRVGASWQCRWPQQVAKEHETCEVPLLPTFRTLGVRDCVG